MRSLPNRNQKRMTGILRIWVFLMGDAMKKQLKSQSREENVGKQ
jgi:hypothetical protein